MEEDSLKDAALVLVVQGCFIVSQQGEDGKEKELHHCYPGGLLGQLQVSWGLQSTPIKQNVVVLYLFKQMENAPKTIISICSFFNCFWVVFGSFLGRFWVVFAYIFCQGQIST